MKHILKFSLIAALVISTLPQPGIAQSIAETHRNQYTVVGHGTKCQNFVGHGNVLWRTDLNKYGEIVDANPIIRNNATVSCSARLVSTQPASVVLASVNERQPEVLPSTGYVIQYGRFTDRTCGAGDLVVILDKSKPLGFQSTTIPCVSRPGT